MDYWVWRTQREERGTAFFTCPIITLPKRLIAYIHTLFARCLLPRKNGKSIRPSRRWEGGGRRGRLLHSHREAAGGLQPRQAGPQRPRALAFVAHAQASGRDPWGRHENFLHVGN